MSTSSGPVPYTNGFTTSDGSNSNVTIAATYAGCRPRSNSGPLVATAWTTEVVFYPTNAACVTYCFDNNHSFAANSGDGCACANSLLDAAVPDANCDLPCSADAPHACGAMSGNYYTVYSSSAVIASANTTANSTSSNSTSSHSNTTVPISNTTVPVSANSTTPQGSNTTLPVTGNSTMPVSNSTMPSNSTVGYGNSSTNGSFWVNNTQNGTSTTNSSTPVNVTVSASSSASSSVAVSSTSTSSSSSASASASVSVQNPPTVQGNQQWSYVQCWGEPAQGRALGTKMIPSDGTVAGCTKAATALGFTYAGLEYGGECWAANNKPYGGGIPESYCNMPCSGDASGKTICGSGNVLSLYASVATSVQSVQSFSAPESTGTRTWSYKSCWGEPAQGRALPNKIIASGATVQSCLALAASRGFGYAGLEYGGECWAGAHTPYGGAIPQSYCNMACTTNPAQSCGSGYVLDLYMSNALPKDSLAVANSWWQYKGCWGEPAQGRALPNPLANQAYDQGTVESCLAQGKAGGFKWCGLEYGSQCWCSYNAPYGGSIPESYCNMPCQNNAGQSCGGGNTLNLYQLTGSW